MSDELKPCPFCGAGATWKRSGIGWAVHCGQRFGACFMNARTHYQNDKYSAIRAWNTRDDLPATDAQALANEKVKALVEALVGLRKWQAPCGVDPEIDAALAFADAALAALEADDE